MVWRTRLVRGIQANQRAPVVCRKPDAVRAGSDSAFFRWSHRDGGGDPAPVDIDAKPARGSPGSGTVRGVSVLVRGSIRCTPSGSAPPTQTVSLPIATQSAFLAMLSCASASPGRMGAEFRGDRVSPAACHQPAQHTVKPPSPWRQQRTQCCVSCGRNFQVMRACFPVRIKEASQRMAGTACFACCYADRRSRSG